MGIQDSCSGIQNFRREIKSSIDVLFAQIDKDLQSLVVRLQADEKALETEKDKLGRELENLESTKTAVNAIPGWKDQQSLANLNRDYLLKIDFQIQDNQAKKIKVSESLQVNLFEQGQVVKKLEHLMEVQTSFCQKEDQLIDEIDNFLKNASLEFITTKKDSSLREELASIQNNPDNLTVEENVIATKEKDSSLELEPAPIQNNPDYLSAEGNAFSTWEKDSSVDVEQRPTRNNPDNLSTEENVAEIEPAPTQNNPDKLSTEENVTEVELEPIQNNLDNFATEEDAFTLDLSVEELHIPAQTIEEPLHEKSYDNVLALLDTAIQNNNFPIKVKRRGQMTKGKSDTSSVSSDESHYVGTSPGVGPPFSSPITATTQTSVEAMSPTSSSNDLCSFCVRIRTDQVEPLQMLSIQNLNETVDIGNHLYKLIYAQGVIFKEIILHKNPGSNTKTAHVIFEDTSSALLCFNQLKGFDYSGRILRFLMTWNQQFDSERNFDAAELQTDKGVMVKNKNLFKLNIKLFSPVEQAEIPHNDGIQEVQTKTGKGRRTKRISASAANAAALAYTPSRKRCKK